MQLRDAVVNWILAIVFAFFAYAHVQQFVDEPRLSLVLLVAVETALVVLFLIRKEADRTSHSWQAWVTTCAGTMFPLLLRPVPGAEDLAVGQFLQTSGVVIQIAALLSLNRSMGLLPAHRGVKTDGAFRIVRHPLYAAYGVMLVGYLINNFNVYNASIIIVGMAFQVMRLLNEESLLLRYPEYTAFADKTRWRLVPFVW